MRYWLLLGLVSLGAFIYACDEEECSSTGESCDRSCEEGLVPICVARNICQCVPEGDGGLEAGAGTTGDGGPVGGSAGDGGGGGSESCPAPGPGDLVIDEILIDGAEEGEADEMIEIVNVSGQPVSMSGVEVLWNGDNRITFEGGCLAGTVAIMTGDAEGMIFNPASNPQPTAEVKTFRFSNSSATLNVVIKRGEAEIHAVNQPARTSDDRPLIQDGVSATRWPPLTGAFERHSDVSDANKSPGTCPRGGNHADGCDTGEENDGGAGGGGDDDGGVGGGDGGGAGGGGSPDCSAPAPGDLVIDEILIDGVVDGESDEFIDVVNVSGRPLDVTDVSITWNGSEKLRFLGGCFEGAVAAYSGDAEAFIWSNDALDVDVKTFRFSNSTAQLDVKILAADGATLHEITQAARTSDDRPLIQEGVSATRWPPLAGPFERHSDFSSDNSSPGRCPGGNAYADGCNDTPPPTDGGPPPADTGVDAGPPPADVGPPVDAGPPVDSAPPVDGAPPACGRAPEAGELIINEVLIDPAGTENDEEFIEWVNLTNEPLDMTGVAILKNNADGTFAPRVTFESGCIPPHGVSVIYPGENPWVWIPEANVAHSTLTLSLANSRTLVLQLVDAGGDMIHQAVIADDLIETGISATLAPELNPNGEFVLHTHYDAERPMSPGECAAGGAIFTACP